MKKYILIITIAIVAVACKISDPYWNTNRTDAGRVAYSATEEVITAQIDVFNMAKI